RPIVIAETGHVGVGRGAWVREIAKEVRAAHRLGVPIEGVCIYPVIDRPDWHDPARWHSCGLWDVEPAENGELKRCLNPQYAAALRDAQTMIAGPDGRRAQLPTSKSSVMPYRLPALQTA